MIVMKFGGTSVGDADRLQHMARLVCAEEGAVTVVVSAMGGTTDALLQAGVLAEQGEWEAVREALRILGRSHEAAAPDEVSRAAVATCLEELGDLLHGVSLLHEQTPRSRALLASFGERLSAPIAAAWIRAAGREAEPVDARDIVRTDDRYDEARVDADTTRALAQARLRPMLERGVVPVVTGFLGSTSEGITTTLGRSGSDYTASLLGGLLGAEEVWIWTDVDGILTADPRLVHEARTLQRVSYREAAEMSYFGARVVHPKTMLPARERGIPIRIRSTFDPDAPGTVISDRTQAVPNGVKVVTAVDELALVTVQGTGLAGIPGVARRIFEATEALEVNVLMISQASSEQAVSVVVRDHDARRLVRGLEERFALERAAGWVEPVQLREHVAVLSVIGDGMAGTPGVSGLLFSALGGVGVNVRAIAQNASEESISVAVDGAAAGRAVRAVHTAFGLTRVVHVALIGCGRVGRELLGMLAHTRDHLFGRDVELRLVAVASSRRLRFDFAGLDPQTVADELNEQGEHRPDDRTLVDRIAAERLTDVILVDVTAGDLHGLHRAALEAGFHVVTANKVPLAGPLADYDALVAARDGARVQYHYETTFAAGLPVLHTLKELVHTGDAVRSVTGCFSGTLGFLCTRLDEGVALRDAVAEARERGYTEPDPREDLSGRDVARKALIVARAIGLRVEPEQVELDAFVPDLDQGLDAALATGGPALAERLDAARARGEVLRYVAEIREGAVRVGLRAVPEAGPIGSLQGPDNILVFHTRRYDEYPLVIRGPGAGAEVTAAGVLGDLLKVARPR